MSYRIEAYDPARHRAALLELWATSLWGAERLAPAVEARHTWLYERAPDGPAHTVVAIHVESGAVIGCASALPRRLADRAGSGARAGMLCDFAIRRDHRTAGPAIAMQRRLAQDSAAAGFDLLFGYPNDAALPIFKRLRWTVVGKARTWVRPLRTEAALRDRLERAAADRAPRAAPLLQPAIAPVARIGGAVADAALLAGQARRALRRPRAIRTEVVPRADERFDALWRRARPPGLTGDKTSAFLQWRYAEFPTAAHRLVAVTGRGGDLLGFAACAVEDDVAVLCDLHCDWDADLDWVLLGVCDRLRREGLRSLYVGYAGGEWLGKKLESHHFFERPNDRSLIVHTRTDAPAALRDRVATVDAWHLFDGELDI
ncbi:MAG: hypothetical protein D6689_13150 [Deltaproteobacteria bacterium]|nr:MAG: hypothetical protein D6689_13150 [Deltaproteobacteria bacterium]